MEPERHVLDDRSRMPHRPIIPVPRPVHNTSTLTPVYTPALTLEDLGEGSLVDFSQTLLLAVALKYLGDVTLRVNVIRYTYGWKSGAGDVRGDKRRGERIGEWDDNR